MCFLVPAGLMVHGSWSLVPGPWLLHGPRRSVLGCWSLALGSLGLWLLHGIIAWLSVYIYICVCVAVVSWLLVLDSWPLALGFLVFGRCYIYMYIYIYAYFHIVQNLIFGTCIYVYV